MSIISRRKFFSFFGAGVVMAAAPKLIEAPARFGVTGPNILTGGDIKIQKWNWADLDERLFFQMLVNPDAKLLPAVPDAPDGVALFATTSDGSKRFKATWA